MSQRVVLRWLCVAAALAAVALVAISPFGRGADVGDEPLLAFAPSEVVSIGWVGADGEGMMIRRDGPGQWVLSDDVGGGEEGGVVWPLMGTRVNAALRILAEMRAMRPADDVLVSEDSPRLRIVLEGGAEHVLRLTERTLGGQGVVEVVLPGAKPRRVLVDSQIHAMLFEPGPIGWRVENAIPGIGMETSRVTLESGGRRLTLARVRGRWHVRVPFGAPAEPDAVQNLLAKLGSISVKRFLDGDAPEVATTGFDRPGARVVLEEDRRVPVGQQIERRVIRRTLELGRPSDISEQSLYARAGAMELARPSDVDGKILAAATLIVGRNALDGITLEPSAYLARRAIVVPGADVGGMVIRARVGGDGKEIERRFELSIDGWSDGSPGELGASDERGIRALLRWAADEVAETIWVGEDAGDFQVVAAVEFLELGGGGVLEKVEIGLVEEGDEVVAVIRTGDVYRGYGGGVSEAVLGWVGGW